MLDLLRDKEMISVNTLNDFLKNFNQKEEIKAEKESNKWFVFGVLFATVAVIGAVCYFVFFNNKDNDYDEFDEYDDFDDLDDEYEDFEEEDKEEDAEEE